jgi:hypothetical protein
MIPYRVAAVDYTTGAPVDTSTDAVSIAIVGVGAKPTVADWHPATRISAEVVGILVGPGGLVVAEGDHAVWVHVVDNPEEPNDPVDILRIT